MRLSEKAAVLLAAAVVALGGLCAYRGTLSAPFVFDDLPTIVDNRSIRHLGSIGTVLLPKADGSGVEGRPLVNLSLALNYALGGLKVEGYHAFNLGIHVLAGLLLFGIARRTFDLMGERSAVLLGGAAAFLWTIHPLLTESVTCVVQRTESMMGFFYLATLYCFVRALPPSLRPEAELQRAKRQAVRDGRRG